MDNLDELRKELFAAINSLSNEELAQLLLILKG